MRIAYFPFKFSFFLIFMLSWDNNIIFRLLTIFYDYIPLRNHPSISQITSQRGGQFIRLTASLIRPILWQSEPMALLKQLIANWSMRSACSSCFAIPIISCSNPEHRLSKSRRPPYIHQ